ncbi:unannotated protein [freshwater metagenome]|uniref:Unannotated protein n=1 Tax=freshwater metagenome TaxID=449393 RepID=A0A6J7VWZ1_9ZZZZ
MIENRKETRSDCDGTRTFQPFEGGLEVSASTIVGSCRATYEASTLLAPLIVEPGFKIKRIFWSLSTTSADSTFDCEIASKACEVSI